MAKTVAIKRSKKGKLYVSVGDWSWRGTKSARRLYHMIRVAEAMKKARGKKYEDTIELMQKYASGPVPIPKPPEEPKTLILTPRQLLELKIKALKLGISIDEILKSYRVYVITTEEKVMTLKEYKKELKVMV